MSCERCDDDVYQGEMLESCSECGDFLCPECFADDGSGVCRACRREEAERKAAAAGERAK